MYLRRLGEGLEAARLWAAGDPRNLDARRLLATLQLRAGQLDGAVETLRDIASGWNEPPGRGYELVAEILTRARLGAGNGAGPAGGAVDAPAGAQGEEEGGRPRESAPPSPASSPAVDVGIDPGPVVAEIPRPEREAGGKQQQEARGAGPAAGGPHSPGTASGATASRAAPPVDPRITVMERVLEALPGGKGAEAPARIAYARVAAAAGDPDRANATIAALREEAPDNDRYAIYQATLLRSLGRIDEGLDVLRTQLARHPGNADLRAVYARLLVGAKRLESARAQFEKLLESAPDRLQERYALALLLLQMDHRDEAERHLRVLVDTAPGSSRGYQDASFYLGQIAEARKEPDEAIRWYRRVQAGQHYVDAQIRIGALYAAEGAVDKAEAHLGAVRRTSRQDDIRLYRAEAEILARAKRYEDALRVYDLALESYPDDADLLYSRAMVAVRADRLDEAEEGFRAVLAREPDNADALNALGYTLADRTDRYQEAYALIKRAYELKPNDHYIIDSLGWVLYRMGRHEEAVRQLRRALQIRPDPEIAAHLGEVLWVLGRREEARAVWDQALRQTPDAPQIKATRARLER